jgi:hypothetical protein
MRHLTVVAVDRAEDQEEDHRQEEREERRLAVAPEEQLLGREARARTASFARQL